MKQMPKAESVSDLVTAVAETRINGFQPLVEHTPPRLRIAFYSVIVAGVILFGAWVYAFALLSLALLMQLGWAMRRMLL